MIKGIPVWVGFSDGEPHFYRSEAEHGKRVLAAFKTRKEARQAYEDVRYGTLFVSKRRAGKTNEGPS